MRRWDISAPGWTASLVLKDWMMECSHKTRDLWLVASPRLRQPEMNKCNPLVYKLASVWPSIGFCREDNRYFCLVVCCSRKTDLPNWISFPLSWALPKAIAYAHTDHGGKMNNYILSSTSNDKALSWGKGEREGESRERGWGGGVSMQQWWYKT